MDFKLVSSYSPRGDQATAIEQLTRGLNEGEKHQVLLGVTGSGKTFTMAKIIEKMNRPALVLAHNKTLAAQLYHEFRGYFPENAVEYFVSYYDYYQPEAYIASTDTYIEKESTINDEIDRLRLSATRSLFERRDVVIVASVSCIYGLGSPEAYFGMLLMLERGQQISRREILTKLVEILYERNDIDFKRGTSRPRIEQAVGTIKEELKGWETLLEQGGRLLEAQRVHQRTLFDMEMIKEVGYCHGIENYSRHLTRHCSTIFLRIR
jgi:excinuclease ABC subunit B